MPVMERFVPKQEMTTRYEASPLCGSHLWRRSQIPATTRRYDVRVQRVKQVNLARTDRGESQTAGLDLAASRGLQVIVLACRPESYATLGAAIVSLDANPYGGGEVEG
jgi:hypothetical protein